MLSRDRAKVRRNPPAHEIRKWILLNPLLSVNCDIDREKEREKREERRKKKERVQFSSIMISPERSFSIRLAAIDDRFVIDRWMATSRAAFLRWNEYFPFSAARVREIAEVDDFFAATLAPRDSINLYRIYIFADDRREWVQLDVREMWVIRVKEIGPSAPIIRSFNHSSRNWIRSLIFTKRLEREKKKKEKKKNFRFYIFVLIEYGRSLTIGGKIIDQSFWSSFRVTFYDK